MLFRITETSQVVTEYEFRQFNNTTSFPESLTADILKSFGCKCLMKMKAKLRSSDCPLGKWNKLNITNK